MPSQAEKLWYITVVHGKAKAVWNGLPLEKLEGIRIWVFTGCKHGRRHTKKSRERMRIQVWNFLFSAYEK